MILHNSFWLVDADLFMYFETIMWCTIGWAELHADKTANSLSGQKRKLSKQFFVAGAKTSQDLFKIMLWCTLHQNRLVQLLLSSWPSWESCGILEFRHALWPAHHLHTAHHAKWTVHTMQSAQSTPCTVHTMHRVPKKICSALCKHASQLKIHWSFQDLTVCRIWEWVVHSYLWTTSTYF